MSINTEIRQALTGYAPLVAHVADRVRLNAAQATDTLPYVVYRTDRQQQRGLSAALHGEVITAELQAWAQNPGRCEQISEAIEAAVAAALPDAVVTDITTGLDPETLLDFAFVRVSILR